MDTVLEINNLCYQDFHNLNLSIKKGNLYFVVGGNRSGKTTLFRIVSSLIVTNNIVNCDGIVLNHDTRKMYIKKIGVVERVNKYSFNYKNVKEEMLYPLINLGLTIDSAEKRINEILTVFNYQNILYEKICNLNFKEKQLLLIMIALLHKPKVLLIDSVMAIFSQSERIMIMNVLKKLISEDNLTIINFTSNLDNIIDSNQIIILADFKIVKETTYNEINNNDKLFYENNLEIPFMFDLVNKLKMYDVINEDYINMKDLVDDIWP